VSATDGDPLHAQLTRLCDVIERLVRVVVRTDERKRVEATGLMSRRCDACDIVTISWECPCCGASLTAATTPRVQALASWERCARAFHRLQGVNGQCLCGVFPFVEVER